MSTHPVTDIPGVRRGVVAQRRGIKGAGAAEWLASAGVAVPTVANRVTHWAGGRCLRQGSTEFLLEFDSLPERPLPDEPGDGARAWLLLRSDHSIVLEGAFWTPAKLSELCSFDFERLRTEPDLVVMTLLAGIAVTFVREPGTDAALLSLRLWCDLSHAPYLDHCLQTLADPRRFGEPR